MDSSGDSANKVCGVCGDPATLMVRHIIALPDDGSGWATSKADGPPCGYCDKHWPEGYGSPPGWAGEPVDTAKGISMVDHLDLTSFQALGGMVDSVRDMWQAEVLPLIKELEVRELRRNHIDEASNINEIAERFGDSLDQALTGSDGIEGGQ